MRRCLFSYLIILSLSGCDLCDGVYNARDQCVTRQSAAQLQRQIHEEIEKSRAEQDQRKLDLERRESKAREEYQTAVRELHVFPLGKSSDDYYPEFDGIVGCTYPTTPRTIQWGLRKIGAEGTANWKYSNKKDTVLAGISDLLCVPVASSTRWRVLFSIDTAHYMINVDSLTATRLWFFYGEMRNQSGQIPPVGRVGSAYPEN